MFPELTTLARAAQIDELVNSRADYGQSILHFAAMSGSHEMFRAVLAILYADQVYSGKSDVQSLSSVVSTRSGVCLAHSRAWSGARCGFKFAGCTRNIAFRSSYLLLV